jgi:hypothetical protein
MPGSGIPLIQLNMRVGSAKTVKKGISELKSAGLITDTTSGEPLLIRVAKLNLTSGVLPNGAHASCSPPLRQDVIDISRRLSESALSLQVHFG